MNKITILGFTFFAVLLLAAYAAYIAFSPPGREGTVDEGDRPTPTPKPDDPLVSLATAWDSEAYANWPVSELMGVMSDISYLPPVDAEPKFLELGFTDVKTILHGSMAGYVVSNDDATVIVFRGTDDNLDWVANLKTTSVKTKNGSLHYGFHQAFQPLKPQIEKLLSASKPKHLWITGHSLGGALAIVCAQDLIEGKEYEIDGVITFGQPMVVKAQLGKHLDAILIGRYAHYVNGNDLASCSNLVSVV